MALETNYEKYCIELGLTVPELEQLVNSIRMIAETVIDDLIEQGSNNFLEDKNYD